MRGFVVFAFLAAPACSLLVSLGPLGALDAEVTDAEGELVITSDAGFCAEHPGSQFCDDFDEVDAAPFARWSSVNQLGGGSVTLIPSTDSPPNAAQFHGVAWSGEGGSPQASLTKTFGLQATSALKYEFDMRIIAYPSSGNAFRLSPLRPDTTKPPQLYFLLSSAMAAYGEIGVASDGGSVFTGWTLTMRPPMNEWTHVELDITIGPPATVTCYIGGMLALAQNTPIDPSITFGAPEITAGVSVETAGPDGPQIDVDNVLFDFQ